MSQVSYDKGLEKFERWVRAMRSGGLDRIGADEAYKIARKIQMLVRARYREVAKAEKDSGPEWTIRATAVGKEAGAVRKERLPMPVGWSVLDELEQIVERVPLGKGKHQIRIAPNRTFIYRPDRGPISHLMADWIENPRPITVPNTFRAMIYRIMMQEDRGGYGTRTERGAARGFLPDKKLSGGIVYTPRERPVWKKVAKDLLSPALKRLYTREMLLRLRKMAVAFGAK